MQIYKNNITYSTFSKKIIILLHVLSLLFITSCSNIDDLKKKELSYMSAKKKCQLKTLIIPKGINFPNKNKIYEIPYTKDDLNKKEYSIFPPV